MTTLLILINFVGTLLLFLGVGVLIGRKSPLVAHVSFASAVLQIAALGFVLSLFFTMIFGRAIHFVAQDALGTIAQTYETATLFGVMDDLRVFLCGLAAGVVATGFGYKTGLSRGSGEIDA